MKLFFLLLLIVLLCSNSNALQCVKHTDPIRFTALNVAEAKEFVSNLEITEGYQVCYILYEVSYPQKDFTVSFGADISQFPGDVNMNVYLEMELFMASGVNVINPPAGYKKFYFKCNDEDGCERHFWRNHIEAFVKEDSTILQELFRSALITEIQESVQCTVENQEKQETCEGNACLAIHSMGRVAGCAQPNQQQTSIAFRVLSNFSVNASFEYGLAMQASLYGPNYICQFDQCNNAETYNKVMGVFNRKNLDLFAIQEALSITLQEKQTTKPEGGSSSTSTVSPTTESESSSTTTTVSSTTEGRSSSTTTVSPKPSISTSIFPETKPTTFSSSTSTSKQTTMTPRNNSILHFISMNIFILHSLFLIFF